MEKIQKTFISTILSCIVLIGSIAFSFAWIYGSYRTIIDDGHSKFDVVINFFPPFAVYKAYKEVEKNYFGNKFSYDNEVNKKTNELIENIKTSHKDYAKEVKVLIGWSYKLSTTQGAEYASSIARNQHIYKHYRNLNQAHFNDVVRGALIYIKFGESSLIIFEDIMNKVISNEVALSEFKFSQEYLDVHNFLRNNEIIDNDQDLKIGIDYLLKSAKEVNNVLNLAKEINSDSTINFTKNSEFILKLVSEIGIKASKEQTDGMAKELKEFVKQVTI